MAKQAETLNDVLNRLDKLVTSEDHVEADFLLLDTLIILGKSEIVDAYLDAKSRCGFEY